MRRRVPLRRGMTEPVAKSDGTVSVVHMLDSKKAQIIDCSTGCAVCFVYSLCSVSLSVTCLSLDSNRSAERQSSSSLDYPSVCNVFSTAAVSLSFSTCAIHLVASAPQLSSVDLLLSVCLTPSLLLPSNLCARHGFVGHYRHCHRLHGTWLHCVLPAQPDLVAVVHQLPGVYRLRPAGTASAEQPPPHCLLSPPCLLDRLTRVGLAAVVCVFCCQLPAEAISLTPASYINGAVQDGDQDLIYNITSGQSGTAIATCNTTTTTSTCSTPLTFALTGNYYELETFASSERNFTTGQ